VLVVIALGGNALAPPGAAPDPGRPGAALRAAAEAVAQVAREAAVVVTHGNGPQIGWLALQAEACPGVRPPPLDVLGAESEGLIGYLVERELAAALPGREVATLLTQTEVDPDDPAFACPAKPIGPLLPEESARELAAQRGWTLAPDRGSYRRVVASPAPRRIREAGAIRRLVSAGVVVVCAGGGGIPVRVAPDGSLRGVEAVVDKDLASGLLAREVGADALLLLTDVAAVYADWPETRRPIGETSPAALRARSFAPGTMGPKVEAACAFVEAGGALAGIGALADAAGILRGEAGTRVRAALSAAR
jgi:carbamate kinase